ncbi:MAG: VWA domain-containing protein [Opitutales bacterium]
MQFSNPQWFLFLAVWGVLAWKLRWLHLMTPRRVVVVLLIFLGWTGLEFKLPDRSMHLWVMMDKSDSIRELTFRGESEWLDLLESNRPEDGTLHVLDIGSSIQERSQEAQVFPEERGRETRIAGALEHVIARADSSASHRVLLFSDGYATDDPSRMKAPLVESAIVVDYRWVSPPEQRDAWIINLGGPPTAQLREAIVIEGRIGGPVGASVFYELLRDESVVSEGEIVLNEPSQVVRFADRPPSGGAFHYKLKIVMEGDQVPGNNEKAFWVRVEDAPRILVLSSYRNDPVATLLKQFGFAVDLALTGSIPDAGKLTGYRSVILNNIGAPALGNAYLEDLKYWVESQGGGLLMIGGRRSFGTGGYFESPIDPILPVSMETREDHKRLAVAMAIVMDRSGSMGMTVAGGKTKMDLANVGAAAAADLLSDYDALTVFAVDSEAHNVLPLTQVGPHRDEIVRRVRSITSMGGGIFVFNGLDAAWKQLQASEAGQRHIILFSDAADSEQPGAYKELIEEMRAGKTTVSVIALGSESDPDAGFLKDIAQRGEGRIFFNTNPGTLPAIFSQETVAVARSAFVEEYVPAQGFPAWLELAQTQLVWPEIIYGYNLSYLRDGASLAANSMDEYQAPLVAFWRAGTGRTAAITFPVDGEIGTFNQGWGQLPELLVTLTRWLQGERQPEGLQLRSRQVGNLWNIDLFYDDTWAEKIDKQLPALQTRSVGSEAPVVHGWSRVGIDHLQASIPIPVGQTQTGAVQIGDIAMPLGPVSSGEDAEWVRDQVSRGNIEELSVATGGVQRLRLDKAWETKTEARWVDVGKYCIFAAIFLILYDALLTRIGTWRAFKG